MLCDLLKINLTVCYIRSHSQPSGLSRSAEDMVLLQSQVQVLACSPLLHVKPPKPSPTFLSKLKVARTKRKEEYVQKVSSHKL